MEKIESNSYAIYIPNQLEEVKHNLQQLFPDATISYSAYTDIWKIETKSVEHSIWYNSTKGTNLISNLKSNNWYNFTSASLSILGTIAAFSEILHLVAYSFFLVFVVTGSHLIVDTIFPKYRENFNLVHKDFVKKIEANFHKEPNPKLATLA